MFSQFPLLLSIVTPIFIVMAIGYGARKGGILTAEADRSLTRLVVMLLAPCLALHVIIGNEALTDPKNWIIPPILGVASVALAIGVSHLGAWIFRLGKDTRRTFIFTTCLQNYGYIPLPLCAALFKDKAIMGVLFAFYLGVEISFWSIALWQLTGHAKTGSWKRALNPPVIAILTAIVLNTCHANLWMPDALGTTFTLLGACAVPMALVLSGALIADHLNAESFRSRGHTLLASTTVRILVVPALMILFAKYAPIDNALKAVIVVQAAMPAAIFPIVVTKVHHGDLPTALQVVLGTSLIGLLTIPLWISFGLHWVL
ncbi:AEC family transporter [soil metagenome]